MSAYVLAVGTTEGCCELFTVVAIGEVACLEHAKRVKAEIEAEANESDSSSVINILMVSKEKPLLENKFFHEVSIKEFMDIFVHGFLPKWYYGFDFEPSNYSVDVKYRYESLNL